MQRNLLAVLAMIVLASTAHAGAKIVKAPEAVPGEYIVKLKPMFTTMSKKDLGARLGVTVKEVLPPTTGIVVVKTKAQAFRAEMIQTLKSNPLVEYIEPNFIYHISKTPNDPEYSKLWGMNNVGQNDPTDPGGRPSQPGVAGVDISAEKAWDLSTGSKDTIVAVIDTGVDYTLPDLKDNIWTNTAELNGKAGVDDDKNGYVDDIHGYDFANEDADPKDDHGHGSHCSGTIGGSGDNGTGVVGVNWNVRIMGVKFLSADGSGSLDAALKAIDYATKMGAHVMSNSWGGGGYSKALEEAIQRSNEAGALFVAAAGNDGENNDATPTYPANYTVPNVLAVAAVNNRGQLADFSCYGRKTVHVGAPGVNVLSTTPDGFKSWSGTSMATPHVSGIAALLRSYQPALTGLQLKERIVKTAVPLAGLSGKTVSGGMANAYAALANVIAPPDENDPANWPATEYTLASAHPYAKKSNVTFTVSVPGAKKFAIHFSKFETENGYDSVEFIDANGNSAGKMSGNADDSFSPVITGDSVTLRLTSDDSVEKYGFDVDQVAVQK